MKGKKYIVGKLWGLMVLSIFGFQFSTAYAQGVIDEVIWVVGDEAILRSEVEDERLRAQYEG